jgi:5-methylcytosine-specific restriction endonuclease McrA
MALKAAHIDRNAYQCASCKGIFPKKEICLDHKEPVVPVDGFKLRENFDLHEFAERLLVEEDGWQVLCDTCHDSKTKDENSQRKTNRKRKKSSK